MYSERIQKIIDLFSQFPTVGPRTAARFVFHIIKMPNKEFNYFIDSLKDLKNKIKTCHFCFNAFEGENELCDICSSPTRNKKILCIVEKESDINSIESIKKYKWIYFVLGGTISNLKKEDIKKLRIKELEERLKNPSKFQIPIDNFEEIILAINPTTEGEATILYLKRKLANFNIKISELGKGLPIGGELEYADEETLTSAFENRK